MSLTHEAKTGPRLGVYVRSPASTLRNGAIGVPSVQSETRGSAQLGLEGSRFEWALREGRVFQAESSQGGGTEPGDAGLLATQGKGGEVAVFERNDILILLSLLTHNYGKSLSS